MALNTCKRPKNIFTPKNHLLTTLDLIYRKKRFPNNKLKLGKPMQISTKSSFLVATTKIGSNNIILLVLTCAQLSCGKYCQLFITLRGCQVMHRCKLLNCAPKLHKSSLGPISLSQI